MNPPRLPRQITQSIQNAQTDATEWLAANLLSWVVPNPQHCLAQARLLAQTHPTLSPTQLAQQLLRQGKRRVSAVGGAAGLFSNPLLMLPATMAELPYVLRAEGELIGTVAALLDPASLDDYDAFSVDVVGVLFPGALSQALRTLGVKVGQVVTRDLIRKYIAKDVLKLLIRLAAKYLGIKLTQKAIIAKTVPLVGGLIGSVWNWREMEGVGQRAVRYFEQHTLALPTPDKEGDDDTMTENDSTTMLKDDTLHNDKDDATLENDEPPMQENAEARPHDANATTRPQADPSREGPPPAA